MSGQRKEIILSKDKPIARPLNPPKISEEEWCDFRIDYEEGMTLKEIAAKYFCDPRTVRKCILQNRPSLRIGKQVVPTRLAPYADQVEELYKQYTKDYEPAGNVPGICKISSRITETIKKEGYQGSERTVRNHLRQKHPIILQENVSERTQP